VYFYLKRSKQEFYTMQNKTSKTVLAILACLSLLLIAALLFAQLFVQNIVLKEAQSFVSEHCIDCEVAIDSFSFTLFPLKAYARGVRIVVDGRETFSIARLRLLLSLRNIINRELIVREIYLDKVYSAGLQPGTPNYQLIESILEEDSEEEKLEEDEDDTGWDVRVESIYLSNGLLIEEFDDKLLRVDGFSATINLGDELTTVDASLNRALLSERGSSETIILVDKATLRTEVVDELVRIKSLTATASDSWIQTSADIDLETETIDATAEYYLDSASLKFAELLDITLTGELHIQGAFDELRANGWAKLPKGKNINIRTEDLELLTFNSFSVRYFATFPEFSVHITELDASNTEAEISLLTPIKVSEETIEGSMRLFSPSIEINGTHIETLDATASIGGDLNSPEVRAGGSVQSLIIENYTTPPLRFSTEYSDNVLNVFATHQSEEFGSAEIRGVLDIENNDLQDLRLDLSELQLITLIPLEDEGTLENLVVSGSGSFSGPLEIDGIKGSTELYLLVGLHPDIIEQEILLHSSLSLENGELSVSFVDEAAMVRSDIDINLREETFLLQLTLYRFRLSDYREDPVCLLADLRLDYEGNLDDLLDGSGQINLQELEIGCDTPSVSLSEPGVINISSKTLAIEPLAFRNGEGQLLVSGQLSEEGYDITSDGIIDLEVVSPLIPLDEAFGLIEFQVRIGGELEDPQVSGEAFLQDAEFILDEPPLWATDVNGIARIDGTSISIESIAGNLNRGTFQLSGTVNADNQAQTSLNLVFDDIELILLDYLEAFVSGTMELAQNEEEELLISGQVEIDEALYERDFDIVQIIRELREGREADPADIDVTPDETVINLEIRIVAEDQLLLITNWAEAEFQADMFVGGTVEEPLVTGSIDLIDGWFRIQANRFEINSARITLDPGLSEPYLELFAEGMIERVIEGDTLITIELVGPISDPEINLTSDRDLAEGEILALVTGGLGVSPQALANIISEQAGLAEIDLLDEDAPLDIDRILQELALVDSLVVAPVFNVETGAIEPSLRAERELTPRFSLFGEHVQAGRGAFSRLLALFELTRRIDIEAAVESLATQNRNPISLSIFYTIFQLDRDAIETQISGNTNLSDREILDALAISPLSRLSKERLQGRKNRLKRAYREAGVFNPQIELECVREDEGFCVEIRVEVQEGQRSRIAESRLEGDRLEKIEIDEFLPDTGSPASRENLQNAAHELQEKLRNAGYTGARVRGSYREIPREIDKTLVLRVRQRNRLEFFIDGNSYFSDETIRAKVAEAAEREVGRADATDIANSLQTTYRREGFADVVVEHERVDIPHESLVHYHFKIEEGPRVEVSEVQIAGNRLLTRREILKRIRESEITDRPPFSEPDYFIESQVRRNAELIERAYSEAGYLDTAVTYEIERGEDPKTALVRYIVNEAPQLAARKIDLEGIPDEVTLPEQPQPPFTQIQINQYIDKVAQALLNHGYLSAAIFSGLDPNLQEVLITVEAGPLTRISKIEFRGNRNIDNEVLLRTIGIQVGDAWNAEEINASRRDLLRLGLFSRVDMRPAFPPLKETEEVLLIQVEERELRGLRVGTGANSEFGLRLFVEGTDRSLFADGRELSASVDTYYGFSDQELTQGSASLRYGNPFFLGTRYRHTEDIRFQRLDTPTLPYSLDRFTLGSYLDREYAGGFRYSIGHTFLAEDLREVAQDAVLSFLDVGRLDLSYLALNLRYDQRDNPLYARKGFLITLNQRVALSELASEADFYAVDSRLSLARPMHWLNDRLYVANSTTLGAAWTFAGTPEIPISQRYLAGGRTSVRGFRENSLGPRGYAGSVIGGDTKFVNNFELRYEARDNIAVHTFFDAGNVFLRDEGIDDLRYSTGFGFRLISPVGPVGFDVGFPLDEREGEPSVRFHFSIGGIF